MSTNNYSNKAAKYLANINDYRNNLPNGYTLLPLNLKLGYALLIKKNETLDTIQFHFLIKDTDELFNIIALNIIDNKNDDFSKKVALIKISLTITECKFYADTKIINNISLSEHIKCICTQCLNSIKLWSKEISSINSLCANFSFDGNINEISENSIIDTFFNKNIYYYLQKQITTNNKDIFPLLKKIKKYLNKTTTKLKFITLGIPIPKINIKTQIEDNLHILELEVNSQKKLYIIPKTLQIKTKTINSLTNILFEKKSQKLDSFEIILCDYNCNSLHLKNKSARDLFLPPNFKFSYMHDKTNINSILNIYLERHAI